MKREFFAAWHRLFLHSDDNIRVWYVTAGDPFYFLLIIINNVITIMTIFIFDHLRHQYFYDMQDATITSYAAGKQIEQHMLPKQ